MVSTRSQANGDEIKRIPLFRVSTQESFDSPIDRRSDFYRVQALQHRVTAASRPLRPQPLFTPPNVCTFARVLMVPLFVLLWFGAHQYSSIATAVVFILASITDWLDGYLARRMGIVSAFGAFLDPVADKIMVSTALVLLATAPPPPVGQVAMVVPVCLVISREITMSALREWAAASGGGAHKAVKVNSLGKWKTALQMVAMSLLLVLRNGKHLLGESEEVLTWLHRCTWASFMLLWVATALALWSLANYMSNVWHYFRYPGMPKPL